MLQGKTAIVTGSARGIGRAIALKLAGEGANLVINCRSSVDEAEAVCDEIRQEGGRAMAFPADVSIQTQAQLMVDRCVEQFGSVDILVNNAGVAIIKPFLDTSLEDWELARGSMLDATFYMTRAVLPRMLERGHGKIIGMSSVITDRYEVAGATMAACSAAKAGLASMLRTVAMEVAGQGITVNCVAPGIVATDMLESVDDTVRDAFRDAIPVKEFVTPEDVANAVLFLVSPQSHQITGQTLRVNGGLAMV